MTEKEFWEIANNYRLSTSWDTGGSFGNCWDNTTYTSEGTNREDLQFDEFLANFADIKFSDYLKFKKHINKDSYHNGCWYGGSGSTEYTESINMSDLLEELKELGYVKG